MMFHRGPNIPMLNHPAEAVDALVSRTPQPPLEPQAQSVCLSHSCNALSCEVGGFSSTTTGISRCVFCWYSL